MEMGMVEYRAFFSYIYYNIYSVPKIAHTVKKKKFSALIMWVYFWYNPYDIIYV